MKTILMRKKISYILKITVVLSAVIGTILSYRAGRDAFMAGRRIFMYFTIQSNIASALICTLGFFRMLNDRQIDRIRYIIKFVITVSITLTGAVFVFMLAPTLGPKAWNMHNTLTHVVVPVAAVLDFFIIDTDVRVKKTTALYVTIPPVLYVIYAAIGYVRGWQFSEGYNYPYFFLNWGSRAGVFGFADELPFMGSAWWIFILLLFLLAVGYGYLALADRIIAKRSCTFRPMEKKDDGGIAELIRTNLKAHGLDIPGTVYFDDNLNHLSTFYLADPGKRIYYVLTDPRGKLMGGVGIAEFNGIPDCAELQKLYLCDDAKGKGLSYRMMEKVEGAARERGYKRIYLETHDNLKVAIHLYEKCGYTEIERPASVVHSTMNRFFRKEL